MPPPPTPQSHAIPPATPVPQSHTTPVAPIPQSHAKPPASATPKPDTSAHREGLSKGFIAITVAGALVASIQGQLLSTTISMTGHEENVAIRAVNAFWVSGLVLDILAALLAFLTCRWLDRLTDGEGNHLEKEFSYRNCDDDDEYDQNEKHNQDKKHDDESQPMQGQQQRERPWRTGDSQWLFYTWLGLSLFIPMPLLVFGIVCMMAGIYTYVWTQHSVIVASLVTVAGAIPLPFIFGDFTIGRDGDRRRKLITRLSEMQGDW